MEPYSKLAYRFLSGGINVRLPIDDLPQGKYRRFTNLENFFIDGAAVPRRSAVFSRTLPSPLHTLEYLFDGVLGISAFIAGAGTELVSATNGTVIDTGYSGNPLSVVEYRPNESSLAYAIFGDSNKMSKVNANLQVYQLGISPPGAVPPFTPSGAPATAVANGAGNLDSAVGVNYDWRYTYYCSFTGGESNPSAIMASPIAVVNQSANVTPGAASTDPQVDTIRFWRRGGTLGDTWRLVGTQGNTTGTFNDNNSDSSIASNEVLSLTNDVPVTTVNAAGTPIYQQPLAYIFGPYQGNVIFGVGNKWQPGFIFWSNPGNPDGWSSINNVEVTQPSDVLQNGFGWNGQPYLFSLDKVFQGFPAPIGSNQFVFYDVGAGHGLAAQWAFLASAEHPAVWFQGRDGIYQWSGSGPAVSITDPDLWPLFNGFAPIEDMSLAQLNSAGTYAAQYRMAYFDNELRATYRGLDGKNHVLGWDVINQRWRHALYPWNPTVMYVQTETQANMFWFGDANGNFYSESTAPGENDANGSGTPVPIACDIRTGYYEGPDPEALNEYGNIVFDVANINNTLVTATILYDNGNGASQTIAGITTPPSTRSQLPYSLNNVYHTDIAVDLSWNSGGSLEALYGMEILWRPDSLPIIQCETPASSWGIVGYYHVWDGYIELRSTANVTCTLVFDNNTTVSVVIPSTGGARLKPYVLFPLNKGKVMQVLLAATDGVSVFRVYNESESLLNLMEYGGVTPLTIRPFFS